MMWTLWLTATGARRYCGTLESITSRSAVAADRVFGALANGGEVQMPLGKTFWPPKFEMLIDRFGVGWMICVAEEGTAAAVAA